MAEITLTIDGMSCQHCVMSVKKAVDSVSGVASADVSIGKAKVVFDELKTNRDKIIHAIQNAGYKVTAGG
jgi:copper chaperone